MQEIGWDSVIVGIALTWSLGLLLPILTRYLFLKRPLSNWHAIGLSALFWMGNLVLFTLLGSQSKRHSALMVIAFVSYLILSSGSGRNVQALKQRGSVTVAGRFGIVLGALFTFIGALPLLSGHWREDFSPVLLLPLGLLFALGSYWFARKQNADNAAQPSAQAEGPASGGSSA